MDMQNLLEVQQDDGELVDMCSMAVLQHGQQQELQVKPLMERGVDDSMLNSWQAANGQQMTAWLCGSTTHRVILRKSLASERCDHFLVTHVQFLMPTTTAGVVGIHRMLRARF